MADEALAAALQQRSSPKERRDAVVTNKRAVTLGELIDEIRNESAMELNMAKRIRKMTEDQLAIYLNFLEKRLLDPKITLAIRAGIKEILNEAQLYRKERRLKEKDYQHLEETYYARIASEQRQAEKEAIAKQDVVDKVRAHLESGQRSEIEEREAWRKRCYTRTMPRRLRRSLKRRNRLWRYCVGIVSVGSLGIVVNVMEGSALTAAPLFHVSVLFYTLAFILWNYALFYVGPRSVRPWEPIASEKIEGEVRIRVDDRLAKWSEFNAQLEREARAEERRVKQAKRVARRAERDRLNDVAHGDRAVRTVIEYIEDEKYDDTSSDDYSDGDRPTTAETNDTEAPADDLEAAAAIAHAADAEEGAQPATASESSARPSAAVAPAAEDDLEAAAVPGPAPAPGNAKKPSFMRRMSSAFGGSKPG